MSQNFRKHVETLKISGVSETIVKKNQGNVFVNKRLSGWSNYKIRVTRHDEKILI